MRGKRYGIRGVLLAEVAPDWLLAEIDAEWFDRYSHRFDEDRLPKAQTEREAFAETIGTDGHRLLTAVYAPTAPSWLADLPAVETLRRVWVQQFFVEEGRGLWGGNEHIPPPSLIIASPSESLCPLRRQAQSRLDWGHPCI